MFLKRLELNGFKSFAGKTVLDFPKGVTAIVGPNGSGKSNVVDAIRWILGERDAKSLRGGKAEDLIFAGTAGKGKAGMATASIFFDNASKFFPVDYEEVEIKRQVERDGTSSYFLNKAETRLKDLVELLSKSRLGTKGLIIIGQGNSDLFIKANPSERREMVEEMLGLREFRIKKSEAERKLKATGFNIEKAKALLLEIGPHLKVLRKQTAKWEKRGELERELIFLENDYFGSQIEKYQGEYLKTDPEINDIERKATAERRELKELEEKLRKIEEARPESREKGEKLRKEKERILEEKSRIEKEMGGAEARAEILEERKKEAGGAKADYGTLFSFSKNFYEEAKRILKEGVSAARAEVVLKEAVAVLEKVFSSGTEGLDKEIREAREKVNRLKGEAKKKEEEIEKIGREENEVNKNLEGFTENFRKAFGLVQEKRENITGLESQRGRLVLEKERWGMKIADLKEAIKQAGRKWEEFSFKKEAEKEEKDLAEMERKIFRLRGELAAIGEVDEALKKEAEETEERHNFLEKQLADLEAAAKDLKEAIEELSEKIHIEFDEALNKINEEFEKFFDLMFKGGRAKMKLSKPKKKTKEEIPAEGEGGETMEATMTKEGEEEDIEAGIELDLALPKKKITGLDVLSGGERSLVSIAALFALISVSPPPFLVLDEADAPLDERNALKFAEMVKDFSKKAQFVVVTHNRATMEAADMLYGVTIGDDGASKLVSLKMTE